VGLHDLLKGITPIDHGPEFPRLSQPCKKTQIVPVQGARHQSVNNPHQALDDGLNYD
jgi:hypothetical protein